VGDREWNHFDRTRLICVCDCKRRAEIFLFGLEFSRLLEVVDYSQQNESANADRVLFSLRFELCVVTITETFPRVS
jgi:hypothetical protein